MASVACGSRRTYTNENENVHGEFVAEVAKVKLCSALRRRQADDAIRYSYLGRGKSTEIICSGVRYINMTGHECTSTVALQICQGIKESKRILSPDKSFVHKNVSENK